MNPKSKTFSLLHIIIAFIVGLVIGLVVLGWGLWPVDWSGGSFDSLNPSDQQIFLRAAIESYAYNPDDAIALQRYDTLGTQKGMILSEILANPGNLEKAAVGKFANAIKAPLVPITTTEAFATSVPVAAPAKSAFSSLLSIVFNRSSLMNFCLPAGMLLVVALIILMVILSRRKKKSINKASQPIESLEPEDAGISSGIPEQGQPDPARMENATTYPGAGLEKPIPEENALPDWLREAVPESQPEIPEAKIEEPAVELSDSDIKEITTSKFSSLDSKPFVSLDSSGFNQAIISTSAFVPDGPDKPVAPEPAVALEPPVVLEPPHKPVALSPAKAPSFQETQEETFSKFSREIELTPGIDPENAKKLRGLGITAPLLLLKKGASPTGRQSIAAGLGIPEMQVLKWVNSVDLLRVKGLTIEDSQILKAIGVDMMVELATRDPESLLEKLADSSKLTDPLYKLPDLALVQNWIAQAQELPRIIAYS